VTSLIVTLVHKLHLLRIFFFLILLRRFTTISEDNTRV
jgi:hypothetical protein